MEPVPDKEPPSQNDKNNILTLRKDSSEPSRSILNDKNFSSFGNIGPRSS